MQRIPSFREILNIAIPIMVGSISESISAIVDTAFMGKLGTLAIDGMGMTNMMLLMVLMIGWSISRSVQILISQNFGANQKHQIGEVFDNGFMLMIPIGIIISLILYFCHSFYLPWIISNSEIRFISQEICQIRAWGYTIMLITLLLNSFYIGIGKTKMLMYSQGIAALSNIGLNYVLVFGKFGLPAMGYKGSAWATVISEIIGFIVIFGSIVFNRELIKTYYLFQTNKMKKLILNETIRLAYPMILLHSFSLGSWVYFFSLVEKMGEKELAISMVLKQIFVAISICGFALASTSNTIVGQLVGSRKIDLIIPSVWKVVKLNYMILLTLAGLTYIFQNPIVRIISEDPLVLSQISMPLLALLSAYIFIPFSNTVFNSISALGDTKIPLILESTVIVIYLVYLYFGLTIYQGGLLIAWTSETLYWGSLLVFCLIYVWKFDWKKRIVYLDESS